jgi:hypothetical protein
MPKHVYEVRPRSGRRGVNLISDALPFGSLWYDEKTEISPEHVSEAIQYRTFDSHTLGVRSGVGMIAPSR